MSTQTETQKLQQPRKKRGPKKLSDSYLENAGLFYLQRFGATSVRFRQVMHRKIRRAHAVHHADTPIEPWFEKIETLIEKFIRLGYLNDAQFAESAIRRERAAGRSAKAILSRLQAKGVDPDKVRQLLSESNELNTELEAAQRLTQKRKIGPYRLPGRDYDPQKELAILARAGFDYETARRALSADETI